MIVKKDHLGKRVIMAFAGTLLAGVSVGGLQKADLGIDPFSSFVTAVVNITHLTFAICFLVIIAVMLLLMVLMNRKLIGIATILNLLLCGNSATIVKHILDQIMPEVSMPVRTALLVVNLLIMCFGASLYFTAELGVSAYDAIALTLSERHEKPAFRVWRISTDVICCAIGFVCGVTLGVGTVITALCMGPVIQWFNEHVSNVILYGDNVRSETVHE